MARPRPTVTLHPGLVGVNKRESVFFGEEKKDCLKGGACLTLPPGSDSPEQRWALVSGMLVHHEQRTIRNISCRSGSQLKGLAARMFDSQEDCLAL